MFLNGAYSLYRLVHFKYVLIGFISSLLLYLIKDLLINSIFLSKIFYIGSISLLIFILLYFYKNNKRFKHSVYNIISGVTLFVTLQFIYNLTNSYSVIQEWDFLCFYLFGKVGVQNSNFYDPVIFRDTFNLINIQQLVGNSFIEEIVNVGFWYPPPTMLLFMPLGFFDLETSFTIWQTILIIFLFVDIIIIVKYFNIFSKKTGHIHLRFLLFLILLLLFSGFESSVKISQTNPIFLFFLLLLFINFNNYKSGIFLSILIIIKPLAIVLAVYFLIFKRWKTLLAFLSASFVIGLITILFFGYEIFLNYLMSPPTVRLPDEVFVEPVNQSLFATLMRLKNDLIPGMTEFVFKIYYSLLSLTMLAVTVYSSKKLTGLYKSSISFTVFIPLAMLIYPATLSHYSLILIPVIFIIFKHGIIKNELFSVITIIFLLIIGKQSLFLLDLVLWMFLVSLPFVINKIQNNKLLNHTEQMWIKPLLRFR